MGADLQHRLPAGGARGAGGFDETLPVAAGEDTDLALRARARGVAYVGRARGADLPLRRGGGRCAAAAGGRGAGSTSRSSRKRHPRGRAAAAGCGYFWKPHARVAAVPAAGLLARWRAAGRCSRLLLVLPWARESLPSYGSSPRGRLRAVTELPVHARRSTSSRSRRWPAAASATGRCCCEEVALLNPVFWPEVRRGSERFARELADGLMARGHERRADHVARRAARHRRGRPGGRPRLAPAARGAPAPPSLRAPSRARPARATSRCAAARRRRPRAVPDRRARRAARARDGGPGRLQLHGHAAPRVAGQPPPAQGDRRAGLPRVRCRRRAERGRADGFRRWLGVDAQVIAPAVDLTPSRPDHARAAIRRSSAPPTTPSRASASRCSSRRSHSSARASRRAAGAQPRPRRPAVGGPAASRSATSTTAQRSPGQPRGVGRRAAQLGRGVRPRAGRGACLRDAGGRAVRASPEVVGRRHEVFTGDDPGSSPALRRALDPGEPATEARCRARAERWSVDACAPRNEQDLRACSVLPAVTGSRAADRPARAGHRRLGQAPGPRRLGPRPAAVRDPRALRRRDDRPSASPGHLGPARHLRPRPLAVRRTTCSTSRSARTRSKTSATRSASPGAQPRREGRLRRGPRPVEELTWGVPARGRAGRTTTGSSRTSQDELVFTFKPHLLGAQGATSPGAPTRAAAEQRVIKLWWTGTIPAREQVLVGAEQFDPWLQGLLDGTARARAAEVPPTRRRRRADGLPAAPRRGSPPQQSPVASI